MTERKRPAHLARAMNTKAGPLGGDLYDANCPSRRVLDHVTSRWGVLVLVALLSDGTHRFSELRRKVGGVSEKMLSQTLHLLEADGFVRREAYPEVPPRVEYSLTPMGGEVAEHVEALTDWIVENLSRVLGAHTASDRARARQS